MALMFRFWHLVDNYFSIFSAVKLPLATDRLWPIVTGHDRQLSCRIFYNSTGSKWHRLCENAFIFARYLI
jgi:hypothetical protein